MHGSLEIPQGDLAGSLPGREGEGQESTAACAALVSSVGMSNGRSSLSFTVQRVVLGKLWESREDVGA